ncbi:hypothetical protein VWZ88_12550 [Phaeobacter sp. JH20_36]|uniref:hypothetical protein n=1 Tax=unclassified Phaeobacter TaxID=2621772 RepID=UPI002766F38D|nr:hypothetical protein MACH17_18550 [Phaeobacter inhibens]
MKSNKENPEDRKARTRDRRISLLENRRAAQGTAEGLTTDLGGVYGLQSLSMFGRPGTGGTPTPQPKAVTKPNRER